MELRNVEATVIYTRTPAVACVGFTRKQGRRSNCATLEPSTYSLTPTPFTARQVTSVFVRHSHGFKLLTSPYLHTHATARDSRQIYTQKRSSGHQFETVKRLFTSNPAYCAGTGVGDSVQRKRGSPIELRYFRALDIFADRYTPTTRQPPASSYDTPTGFH